MLELARIHEVPVIADLHGGHLRRVLAHGPWLVKPSLDEFHELISRHTDTLRERALVCQALSRESGVILALSMSAEGLLVTGPGVQWLLESPPLDVHLPGGRGRNAIGCGDALVGALAFEYCATRDLAAAVKLGVAAAHTNLGTFGPSQIDPEETRRLAKAIALEVVDTS
jgi:fructose-1-phosphate kinase PfkB-like protein